MEEEKRIAGEKAADYIADGMTVGLGTGSTAKYLVEELGRRVRLGLSVTAVATSQATAALAGQLGIRLAGIDDVERIDLAIDGVDEIDSRFNAIKGGGGALFREKMVASLAREVIWIMDSSKPVDALGAFPLPVEILPYGHSHILQALHSKGLRPALRMHGGEPFQTDNGNLITDLHLGRGFDISAVSQHLKATPGVLETGLFLNFCNRIIVGTAGGAVVTENPNPCGNRQKGL